MYYVDNMPLSAQLSTEGRHVIFAVSVCKCVCIWVRVCH